MAHYRRAIVVAAALISFAGCAREKAIAMGQEPAVAGSLEGGPWLVEDINGGGVIDNARVDISFDPGDGGTSRVSGQSGCNRFTGAWEQTGARIKIGPVAGTRMMCAPALMNTEAKFLATLNAATSLRYDATGAAYLVADDGRVIKLRRAAK